MSKKKKIGKVKIVRPNNVNYTFVNNDFLYIRPENKQNENNDTNQKLRYITKKSIKNLKMKKSHYKSNTSPKSQQNHSPVYE